MFLVHSDAPGVSIEFCHHTASVSPAHDTFTLLPSCTPRPFPLHSHASFLLLRPYPPVSPWSIAQRRKYLYTLNAASATDAGLQLRVVSADVLQRTARVLLQIHVPFMACHRCDYPLDAPCRKQFKSTSAQPSVINSTWGADATSECRALLLQGIRDTRMHTPADGTETRMLTSSSDFDLVV
jgi:hypothetical protein